jgi:leucine carboxyl methyltransferase
MDPTARTQLTAADRAREGARGDGLFHDPMAELLAGQEGFALLAGMPDAARGNHTMAIRTPFFDDWLAEVARDGRRQGPGALARAAPIRARHPPQLPGRRRARVAEFRPSAKRRRGPAARDTVGWAG